jgi:transcriptional regulator with XRE-family HTH domain
MDKLLYKEAGTRIYQLRVENGYTREELAELADISIKFLYEVENGKKGFSAQTLLKISIALSTDCDYILKGIS